MFREWSQEIDVGLEVARVLDLTPLGYADATGSRAFLSNEPTLSSLDRNESPSSFLGWMCLKVLRDEEPSTGKTKRPYTAAEKSYFWDKLNDVADEFPKLEKDIRERRPSFELRDAVKAVLDRWPVFTATGRLRANASYTMRRNTMFQGLAADGCKLGLWYVWRAGYRICNFIHDELLVAIPVDSRLGLHAETIRQLMLKGLREVVPDVRVDVDYAVTDRWYKGGKKVIGDDGKLAVYTKQVDGKTLSAASTKETYNQAL